MENKKLRRQKMGFMILLTEAGSEAPVGGLGSLTGLLMPLGIMIALIYFVMIRPEGKRKKRMAELLSNIQFADEVVTAGGIIGRVVDIKPDSDTVVIETGGDKTRFRILKAYIIENRTIHDD